MDFGVLTRFYKFLPADGISRLNDELKVRGHRMTIIRPLEMHLREKDGNVGVNFLGQPWKRMDYVLPLLRWNDDYGWCVMKHLGDMGQAMLKTSRLPQQDRVAVARLFQQNGTLVIPSFLLNRTQIWEQRGNVPWPMLIQARLTQTSRLQLILNNWNELDDCLQEVASVLEEPLYLRPAALMQGTIISVMVVGDTVLGGYARKDAAAQYKPGKNVKNPPKPYNEGVQSVELTVAQQRAALVARRLYGVTHAVVDLRDTSQGPMVVDVNTAPNLAWYERMVGYNVAGKIIEHWESLARSAKEEAA